MMVDYIFMNPPYDKNLHLKILEQTIPMLSDDGILVNLSPIRWLQDYLYNYKSCDFIKFENTVSKYIKYINVNVNAKELFGIDWYNLGIYIITKTGGWDYYSLFDKTKKCIVDKIMKQPKVNDKLVDTPTEFCLKFPQGHGHDGKADWYELFSSDREVARSNVKSGSHMMWINFDNDAIAENCRNFYELTLIKFFIGVTRTNAFNNYRLVPYLGDVENPRTHKTGYESDWTNEDLCKVFGITGFISDTEAEPGSEWETILETMKPYL